MSALVQLTAARRAIAKAVSVDELSKIRDCAEAARTFAKARGLSVEAINDWAEVKVRAERRAGEILGAMEKNKGARGVGVPSQDASAPTLEEIGVTHSDSSRWQAMARIPEETFEAHLAEVRNRAAEITTAAVLQAADKTRTARNLLRSESNEWYTPDYIIEAARESMGRIDLDPASSAEANEIVKAGAFYSIEDDGLSKPWHGSVWLNPPYGDAGPAFVARALAATEKREIEQATILLSAHATDAAWFRPLWDYLLCFSYGRLPFRRPGGSTGSPTMGSVIAFISGPNYQCFADNFREIGAIVTRWRP